MMDIKNCPSTLASGYNTYSPVALRRLFDGKKVSPFMDLLYDDDQSSEEVVDNVKRISISGVQEKLSAIVIKGKISLTPAGEQGRYIIKPAPNNKTLRFRQFIPANEHLTMQIARQVFDIQTAENGLIFFMDGNPAYITKRFDISVDGTKIKQEDFASIIGKSSLTHGDYYKYTGSYEDIALHIKKHVAAWKAETVKFFRLVVFNYLFCNSDAHLKNFSLQQTPDGDYILSPAYDLMNASLHIDDSDFALEHGLSEHFDKSDIYSRTGHPCREDFESFGMMIGLNELQIKKVITPFLESKEAVYSLIENSFLDDRLKRMYKRSYEQRIARFNRK